MTTVRSPAVRRALGVLPALVLALAPPLSAQLTDLQPGRNFPTATAAFGQGRSGATAIGDVDHDGDYDVAIGNGWDFNSELNFLYLNDGGAQGGTAGTFTDATATRFAGLPADRTRDLEFVDLDGDTDLDVFTANTGTSVNAGEVSRAYLNQGGAQQGSIGFFAEVTDALWGTLVSVPSGQEVGVVDGMGPFKEFSCDCDFGDLDDDGDLDLFHAGYGLNMNGTRDSRIFLNNGVGRFDELWPWADPAADTKLHTRDVDLADLDGDFDLDIIASSRDSQARLYRNDLTAGGWSGSPFTDVTQTSFFDNGSGAIGTNNYGVEYGDLDADGDFDLWMVDYDSFRDVVLRNDGGLDFSRTDGVKVAAFDEFKADFLDYDGDGDLDVFLPNFSGTNHMVQSGLADGVPFALGLFHQTGTTSEGSLASWPEMPATNNRVVANDGNQGNRYFENVLGVPDTHAPTFAGVTDQADKADGSDTVIHAAVRDNASYDIVAFYDTVLLYTVDGGPETCVPMTCMGGMQFRGVIPGGIDGAVTYRVECTDDAGNTGVSASFDYQQTSSGTPLWQNLGCGTAGSKGVPKLSLGGSQVAGEPVDFALVDAHASAFFLLWIAFTPVPAPAVGGTVYAAPFDSQVLATTDAGGMRYVSTAWPPGVPPGTEATWQCVVADPTSIHGLTLSNAVRSISP